MVAATAEANGCVVVTDNERHFAPAVPFLNPSRVKSLSPSVRVPTKGRATLRRCEAAPASRAGVGCVEGLSGRQTKWDGQRRVPAHTRKVRWSECLNTVFQAVLRLSNLTLIRPAKRRGDRSASLDDSLRQRPSKAAMSWRNAGPRSSRSKA